ncbi:hypothetical protein KY289_030544 [Solanum tuberosum]|nr:hypothetical protein KY289_030544 [Solanum tuberosum]
MDFLATVTIVGLLQRFEPLPKGLGIIATTRRSIEHRSWGALQSSPSRAQRHLLRPALLASGRVCHGRLSYSHGCNL